MIIVVLLIAYIAIASALIFGFTSVEWKMSDLFINWDYSADRAIACAIFWPVCVLPYVAYAAAIYYNSKPRSKG